MSGDDEDGIDFSVITRAIKCGGTTIDQLLNGVHYGTSEVRGLLLDECDLIIECKVCRNLFRALPNFIAHKRVYCLEAFQDPNDVVVPLTQDIHNAEAVVVEPLAPETSNNHNIEGETETCIRQPTNTLVNTIQQIQNGTFEGKSEAYKFYTDVADKVDRSVQSIQTHYIQHEAIPGNPNAVRVSLFEAEEQVFTDEITPKDTAPEQTVLETDNVTEPNKSSNVNLQGLKNSPAERVSEKPESFTRSARLRAKSEKRQLLQEKVKSPTKKESKSKVENSVEDRHTLREKAKKMFLYPVRKTVTDAKDCDLKRIRCLLCQKKFANLKCLKYHMQSLHSSTRAVFPCPLCSTVLKHKWGWSRHLMRSHSLNKTEVVKMKEDRNKLNADKGNKKKRFTGKLQAIPVKNDKTQEDKKKNSSIKNSSPNNISSQGRTRSNSALEKKARFLVDSAKAGSMPRSSKNNRGESVKDSTDLGTGPNERPKKEFSVKICSRTNLKSSQFYSGLNLLQCKMCSKAFAKKESLLAHSRVCSSALNNVSNDNNLHHRQANQRSRQEASKVEPDKTVQKSNRAKDGYAAKQNEAVEDSCTTANRISQGLKVPMSAKKETDILVSDLGQISPVKVVLEHCDVFIPETMDMEAESPRRGIVQPSAKNEVDERLMKESDDSLMETNDVNSKTTSTCDRESKTINATEKSSPLLASTRRSCEEKDTHSKAVETSKTFQTGSRTRQRKRAANKLVLESEVDGNGEDFKTTSELVPNRRQLSKRLAATSKKRTLSEGSAEMPVKTIADVDASPEVHQMNSSVGTSVDLESSDNGADAEVSFISEDELIDMQKRLEAQLGQQISEVSQELRAKGRPKLKTIRSVEEIWVSKSPGKPTEKLKSNRMYVLDTSNNKRGRPYCQDSKRINLIIDEKNLKCLECGELFRSVSNMRRHAIRHLGWQRYRCKLCSSYCSYYKSEMKSHLVRVHSSTVNPLGNSFLKYCMIDLGKEGSRLRAQKRQRTLSSKQAAEAAADTSSVIMQEAAPSTDGSSNVSTENHQRDRKKSAVSLNNIVDPDPRRFNISTRNSPRVFDTRPIKRADSMQTLITRKGSYPKQENQPEPSSECPGQSAAEAPPTCSVSAVSEESPRSTLVKSKTRSIDFRKTRSVDNPWVDGFYKRLALGGSLGAVHKEQLTIRPFKNRKGDTIESGSSSLSSISSHELSKVNSPSKSTDKNSLRPTKSDSSLQSTSSPACKNLTATLQNE